MANINQGYGQDGRPAAPHNVTQPGTGGSGGSFPSSDAPRSGGRRRRWAAVLAITAVMAGGGAFAAAEAATGGPAGTAALAASTLTSTSTQPDTSAKAAPKDPLKGHGRLGRLRRLGGLYGQYTLETKKGVVRTVAFERGTIESVSGDDVVVRARNGITEAWTLTSTSVVRKDGKAATESALTSGELVFTGGPVTGGAHDIRLIVIRKSAKSAAA
jgi:hypothetical protein